MLLISGYSEFRSVTPHQIDLEVEVERFPAGEVKVTLPGELSLQDLYVVRAHLTNSDQVMALLLTVDALRRFAPQAAIDLSIPYFPYARQDRVCAPRESLSVAVMARLINSLNVRQVTVLDPHSDVLGALLDRCVLTTQLDLLKRVPMDWSQVVFVAPDAGAQKKVYALAEALGVPKVICASKHRDPATGRITATEVSLAGLTPAQHDNLWVIDDIFDGGRTFVELAKALHLQGATKPKLFVTHGIFTKGFEEIQKYYELTVTTNSFHPNADGRTGPNGEATPKIQWFLV